ncbi:MAG: acyltransferase family protein [Clostridia bacterium]|nr:acyltransferase family protein [Clostridia bacterium]
MKTELKNKPATRRILWIDELRIFSIFCMMVLHVAASCWNKVSVDTFEWQVFNVYDGLVRFCVPVFVMISGSFFLDNSRELTVKKLFRKNISRIAAAFFFWSFCYSLVLYFISPNKDSYTFGVWFKEFICGRYHLWYLFAIFSLYLATPILRKITADKKTTEYFIILAVIFTSVIKLLKAIKPIAPTVTEITNDMGMNIVVGYSGYFVLGYYLNSTELTVKIRRLIYIFGAVGVLTTVIGTSIWSLNKGSATTVLYQNFMPNVWAESVAVFVAFKYGVSKINHSEKYIKVISKLSALSFGMYLFHDFVNIAFKEWGFTTLLYNPVLSVFCNTVLVFVISFAVVWLLSKIPLVNKYIM